MWRVSLEMPAFMWVGAGVGVGVCVCVCVCSCDSCTLCEARLWHPVPFPRCLSIWSRASLSELCVTVGYSPIITVKNADIRSTACCACVCACAYISLCGLIVVDILLSAHNSRRLNAGFQGWESPFGLGV